MVNWKDKKKEIKMVKRNWKKGNFIWGIIFASIFVLIILIGNFVNMCIPSGWATISKWLYPPLWFIKGNLSGCYPNTLDIIISLLIWFVLGTVIGWIIGKIRKKK
jgi:hypothetical protein